VFEISRNDGLANGILQGQRISGALLALFTVALLVRRWRSANEPQRRSIAPVLWAGSATIAVLAVSIGNDAVGEPLRQAAKWALDAVFASVPIAVLVVLLQRRLARGAVAGLVVELGDRSQGSDLRDALARALGDPALELAYWFGAGDRYVDADGRTSSYRPPTRRAWRRWSSGTAGRWLHCCTIPRSSRISSWSSPCVRRRR
jgi:hypothetical protein